MNLNWGPIMKTINDDPYEFFQQGGWSFLGGTAVDEVSFVPPYETASLTSLQSEEEDDSDSESEFEAEDEESSASESADESDYDDGSNASDDEGSESDFDDESEGTTYSLQDRHPY